jgi:enamine deaminase RidA (YjgF/YER057c/UK114 family)
MVERVRQTISSGTSWERSGGYSRAVRVGNHVFVAGTNAYDEQGELHGADAYAQARYVLRKIERALDEAGAQLSDVVRTRIYLRHLDDWPAAGRAHGEVFAKIRPANTLIQVAGLVGDPLLEIEAEAVVEG